MNGQYEVRLMRDDKTIKRIELVSAPNKKQAASIVTGDNPGLKIGYVRTRVKSEEDVLKENEKAEKEAMKQAEIDDKNREKELKKLSDKKSKAKK